MRDMARENGEQFALLPYKEEIGTLAQSLKGVLGADVIVVDKYLNRIVNTFHPDAYFFAASDDTAVDSLCAVFLVQHPQAIGVRRELMRSIGGAVD